jgi:hypothetical protein
LVLTNRTPQRLSNGFFAGRESRSEWFICVIPRTV